MTNRITNDPILTGNNPKADERLLADVAAGERIAFKAIATAQNASRSLSEHITGDVAASAAVEACRDFRRIGVAAGIIQCAIVLNRAAIKAYEAGNTIQGDAYLLASELLTDRTDEITKAAERR